ELKRPRGDTVDRALRLLTDDDVLVSFQRRAIEATRRRRPKLPTVQHVGFGVSIRRAHAMGVWAAGFQDERVTPRGIAKAQALGLETTVYTVNDEARLRQPDGLGVPGVFTDVPERALRALRHTD